MSEEPGVLHAAAQAMEDQEIELFAELHARTASRLPREGTESERLAALIEIVREDPEALDLCMRLKSIEHFGGGSYTRALLELGVDLE